MFQFSLVWLTVSKALAKSKKTQYDDILFNFAVFNADTMAETACSVDLFFGNQIGVLRVYYDCQQTQSICYR